MPRLVDEVIDSTSASMKRLRSLGDAKSTTSTEEGDHFSFSVYPGSAARVIVMANSIPVTYGQKQAIENAVCQAVGRMSGTWELWLEEPQNASLYRISIKGPDSFQKTWTFDGPDEQNPDFIRDRILRDLPGFHTRY